MSHWCQCLYPRAPEPANCTVTLDFLHRIRPCTADFWKYPFSRGRLWDYLLIATEKIFKYISYSHSRAVKIYFILIRVSNLLEQDKFSSFDYCKFKLKKCSEFIHSLWLNHETNVSLEMKVSKWIPGLRWKILCWFLAESGWRVARKDNLLSWWSGTDFSSAINKSINKNK